MHIKKTIQFVYLSGLLLILPVLIILPADFFDSGPTLCLSRLLFNVTCYGCGITRAIQHLIHLDIYGASAYNKMSFIVLPLLLGVWFTELKRKTISIRKTLLKK